MTLHVQNENFILDSTRISMKVFHLHLFHGRLIFPECILIFGLILLLMINSTSNQKDRPWFYFISSASLVIHITALLFRLREEPIISFSKNFQMTSFNEIFQFLNLLHYHFMLLYNSPILPFEQLIHSHYAWSLGNHPY